MAYWPASCIEQMHASWLCQRSSHSTFSCLLVLACPLAAHAVVIGKALLVCMRRPAQGGLGGVAQPHRGRRQRPAKGRWGGAVRGPTPSGGGRRGHGQAEAAGAGMAVGIGTGPSDDGRRGQCHPDRRQRVGGQAAKGEQRLEAGLD